MTVSSKGIHYGSLGGYITKGHIEKWKQEVNKVLVAAHNQGKTRPCPPAALFYTLQILNLIIKVPCDSH